MSNAQFHPHSGPPPAGPNDSTKALDTLERPKRLKIFRGRLLAFGELDDLVDYANSVFTPTRFLHEEKEISGVTFHLNKVKYHSSDCSDTNSADNPFCGSGQFMTLALRRFAQSDHSGSCASLLFTYRQFFEKEVLGMSYVGGVCRDADLYGQFPRSLLA